MHEPAESRYVPLSVRAGDSSDRIAWLTPAEGVPDHLRSSLVNWIDWAFSLLWKEDERDGGLMLIERVLRFSVRVRSTTYIGLPPQPRDALNLVDFLLYRLDKLEERSVGLGGDVAPVLDELLADASSVWTVTPRGGGSYELTRRVPSAARDAAALAMAPQTLAADHLRRSWSAAYRREPDYKSAYDHAVLAVEAVVVPAAIPTAAPNRRTLGGANAHIRQTSNRWTVNEVEGSSGVLLANLELLWNNHPRHADEEDGSEYVPVTRETAQVMVSTAITVVQWFTTGAVRTTDHAGGGDSGEGAS